MTPTPESLTEAVRRLSEGGHIGYSISGHDTQVLATALDEHKAFKREVSDTITDYCRNVMLDQNVPSALAHLIIPEPPVDPLVEVFKDMDLVPGYADRLRAELAKRNARIVFDSDEPELNNKNTRGSCGSNAIPDCGPSGDSTGYPLVTKPDAAEVWDRAYWRYRDWVGSISARKEAAIAVIAEALGGKS